MPHFYPRAVHKGATAAQKSTINAEATSTVKLDRLKPGRNRLRFKEEKVEALQESIIRHGLLHPILARRSCQGNNEFEVISGHRRLEALRRIGAEKAECRIVEATDKEAFEISLVENLQRDSIDPLEEALAFHQYVDVYKWGTRRTLANRIGKSQEYITHRLQLLQLPEDVLSKIGSQISASHAEELAWLNDKKAASRLAELVVEKRLSVHELHKLANLEKQQNHAQEDLIREKNLDVDFYRHKSAENNGNETAATTTVTIESLKTTACALRYIMHYIDDSVRASVGKPIDRELVRFLTAERYKIHQILDDFIKEEVRMRRAARGNSRLCVLAQPSDDL